jgi:starch-binding outer membrane protein, SusD/RagB family
MKGLKLYNKMPLNVKVLLLSYIIVTFCSCKKLIEIDPPTTSINQDNVYKSDNSAISALTSIYADMSNNNFESGFTGVGGMSLLSGLSSDELTLYNGGSDTKLKAYYKNSLLSTQRESYGTEYWLQLFNYVFRCNAAIEGLTESTTLSASVKQQLLGEAKFMRAFFYFYLVNLYGDVPLALTTDPQINSHSFRTLKQDVYKQIITDLKDAENLLSASFLNGSLKAYSERLRPTTWAAAALLARVYLYTKDFSNAELEATKVISQTSLFSFPALNNAFLKNSTEAIWQLQPVQSGRNTEDAFTFILPPSGPTTSSVNPVYLSPQLLNAFEANDARKTAWVNSVTANGATYYYPYKYKATISSGTVTEYLMMLRLAEQYLIRAEARAMLNNFQGAKDDLNAIRTRAGLGNTTASDQASLLAAILHERQVELFTELAQRWFDLKRTGNVDNVMNIVTPLKGGTWNSNWQLYPIPFDDIQRNPNLLQNSGY